MARFDAKIQSSGHKEAEVSLGAGLICAPVRGVVGLGLLRPCGHRAVVGNSPHPCPANDGE